MAWVSVTKYNEEIISESEFFFDSDSDAWFSESPCVVMPKGSIKKLIGRELTWNDEPVELE